MHLCKSEREGGEWIVKIKRSGLAAKPAGLSIIKLPGLNLIKPPAL